MEEKLRKEKEEKELEEAGKVITATDNHNEIVEDESDSEDKRSPPVLDAVAYTPGPIRVPTVESSSTTTSTVKPVVEYVSELPPVPQTVVEQERLEMIEINNDGTSGHLTHSLEWLP